MLKNYVENLLENIFESSGEIYNNTMIGASEEEAQKASEIKNYIIEYLFDEIKKL